MHTKVLIVHLEAIGAVLRSTALLRAIHRRFPGAHITWVTKKPADQLLRFNPLVDRVLTTDAVELTKLRELQFDVSYCIDKSLDAVSIAGLPKVDFQFGFTVDRQNISSVLPATSAAIRLWQLGLDDHQKFYVNQSPETQLIFEALELGAYTRDEYECPLTVQEQQASRSRRMSWQGVSRDTLIGINTGCSGVIRYKKLGIEQHVRLLKTLHDHFDDARFVLLGGPEDTREHQIIQSLFASRDSRFDRQNPSVILSQSTRGLRDGLVSVDACDVVISGDSLGMHMAIARRKWVVAWFGPTCSHEIDLYGRGRKVLTTAGCSPCWKRSCDQQVMCYEQVPFDEIVLGIRDWQKTRQVELTSTTLPCLIESSGPQLEL